MVDILEGAYSAPGRSRQRGSQRKAAEPRLADYADQYADLSPQALAKKIDQLEKQMFQHSRDLEFEEAARIRDEIKAMKSAAFVR